MQAAAILVVREKGGYEEGNDRWVDIRVDDHPSPIEELKRIFRVYDLTLLAREDPATLVKLEGETVGLVQRDLGVLGYLPGPAAGRWDPKTQEAFGRFLSENNFENKARNDGTVWPSVLRYLHERAEEALARRAEAHPIVPGALDRGPGAAPARSPSPTPTTTPAKKRRRRA
jgi:uncharacterized Ntn-hydrolase superfamily protein